MPLPLELELIDGAGAPPQRWSVPAGRFRIGRGAGNELSLAAPDVSRRHAEIDHDGRGWVLRDCRSRSGTRLNELPLAPGGEAALHSGDVIAIGACRLRVAPSVAGPARARREPAAGLGRLAEQRLELLLGCAGELAAAADEQALADVLAEHALLGSGCARAAVLWRRPEGGFALRALRPVGSGRPHADGFPARGDLLAAAERTGLARTETGADGRGERQALCAPLLLDGRAEAFLYLDSPRAARRGHADAPTFVQALARMAALALANLRRLASEREHARLAADLERAREVQRRLLPDERAALGGLRFALHLQPGRAVAGDIADVFALPDGRVAALLGDVSGAGLGAGLVMASVQSFLRADLAHDGDPARALARLNRHLAAQGYGGRFVTLWLGLFDPAARRVRFVDAGHGHAVRLGPGRAPEPIRVRGDIPLGIDAGATFAAEETALGEDGIVLLYSDGMIERRAPDGAPFGRERLLAAAAAARAPGDAVAAVLAALDAHAAGAAADDDATVLACGWDGRSAS